MITKNHPSAYAELFKKAQEVLSKYGGEEYKNINISNIDDYFGCLKSLADIERASEKGEISEVIDPIFTILPATEETFNIDANKRSISIPDNFAKYGVGVQGDEIAEILYFSIDRYFDAMDLADMDIIVQWKHSNDNDLVNNLSATYKKSLTLQPGKIVFGWPITSEITEKSGNIKFSIRFYRRENNELIYSFSTLPATIKIQAGLDFSLAIEDTDLAIRRDDRIYSNLRNSTPANVDYIVAVPVFEQRWIQEKGSEDLIPANGPYDTLVTLAAKAGFTENTEGEISGNGISYSWYKVGSVEELKGQDAYKIANINDFNSKEIYYVLNNGVYEPYYLDGNPFDDEEVENIYVKYSKFTPDVAGSYYVKATNAYTHNNSKFIISDNWIISGADDPQFTYNNENREILIEDESPINIIVELPEFNILEKDEWYRSESATFDNSANIIQDISGATYTPTVEGYYYRVITNSKNGDSKTSISLPVWARHDASDILELRHYINGNLASNFAVDPNSNLEVRFDNLIYSDNIKYQWYRNGTVIENATANQYLAEQNGNYYCIVTNYYKGNTKTKQSETFKI